MAYANFKPIIWSTHIQRELEKLTVLQEDCNTEFEGEASRGSRVKILGVARPTIANYTGATLGTPETLTDTAVYLDIDQAKSVNFMVDDIDKAQSVQGLMQTLMAESAAGFAEARDTYIASLAVNAGAFSTSAAVTTAAVAKTAIDTAFTALWDNGVKINSGVSIVLTPWYYNLFKDKLTELYTNNIDMIKKGIVGMYNGAYVKLSNNLYNDGTDDYMIIRTKKAIAFAGQISKVEPFRPEGYFSDAVKSLDTYGAKVVRPKEMYVIKARKA